MREILKNFNAFVDGKGYAGQVEEFEPPKVALTTEEFRAGGMAAPIDITMGTEKMEASLTLTTFGPDLLGRLDVVEGKKVNVTLRGGLESHDGTVTAAVWSKTGKIKEIDAGSIKPGQKNTVKVTFTLDFYKVNSGGRDLLEIDVPNMVHKVNGTDQLAPMRGAIGR